MSLIIFFAIEFIIDAKYCGGECEELSTRVDGTRVDVRIAIQEQRGERKHCSRDERCRGDRFFKNPTSFH